MRGSGGERKTAVIVHYRSSKSTALDVCMKLILRSPDQMAEIVPDRKKWNRQELSCDLKGFGIHLTATIEKEHIHDITKEINRRVG